MKPAGIYEKYAPKYDRKKTLSNLYSLLKQFREKKFSFAKSNNTMKDKGNDEVEAWWTKKNGPSKAYLSLWGLYMDSTMKFIYNLSAEEIRARHPKFMVYPIEYFKKYNRAMEKRELVRNKIVHDDEESFQKDCLALPRKEKNKPWYSISGHSSCFRTTKK